MSKLKGLAKIDLREEVDGCIAGLRSTDVAKVIWSAVHLKEGLAELVGSHLLPFVNRLGGELVSSIKKNESIDELWEAASSVCLAVGKASSRTLCEPLIDIAAHKNQTHLSCCVVASLRTFITVCGRLISPPVRSHLDYKIVGSLYQFLIYKTLPDPEKFDADGHLMLLSDSVNLPYLTVDSPMKVHAAVILEAARYNPRLSIYTRTSCSSARAALDAQTHCKGAPIVVPSVDELFKHLRKLNSSEEDDCDTTNLVTLAGVAEPAVSEIQQMAQAAVTSPQETRITEFEPIAQKSENFEQPPSRKRSRSLERQASVLAPLPVLTPTPVAQQPPVSVTKSPQAVVTPVDISFEPSPELSAPPKAEEGEQKDASSSTKDTVTDDEMSSGSDSSIELGEMDL
eukprot:TRINITY_DN16600_c0_g1_i1.p1 TRINITY_DN16600_c0_g1~~TRINITY_DN16600_c0_g1_i1.p1  ORF type:complete len:399 (+),score=89.30 TRINITY_DN16600_c0_g1_i1:80-1276(+)